MELALTILGYVLTICTVLLVTSAFVLKTVKEITALIDKRLADACDDARKNLGKYIMKDYYWFSESEDARELMKILGKSIYDSGSGFYDPNTVREEWRRRTEK